MALNMAYRTGSAVSITNTETSLAVDGGSTTLQTMTDDGVYTLFLDGVANMVKADEYLLKLYETAVGGGTKRVFFELRLKNAQSKPLILPNIMLGVGWDMTLQRISASSRAFDWSIRRAF